MLDVILNAIVTMKSEPVSAQGANAKASSTTTPTTSGTSTTIPYATLSRELGLEGQGMAGIEDAVIGAMEAGLVQGRLDQRANALIVHAAASRDVPRQGEFEVNGC